MYIDIDQPSHSMRMGRDRDGPLLVVLGPRFMTGNDGDVAKRFVDLGRWARANMPAGEVACRWVNEDYDSPDDVIPYAGELAKDAPRMYVATGFNGWGISNGTAAARLIADQVLGVANAWTSLYDPKRRSRKEFKRRRQQLNRWSRQWRASGQAKAASSSGEEEDRDLEGCRRQGARRSTLPARTRAAR